MKRFGSMAGLAPVLALGVLAACGGGHDHDHGDHDHEHGEGHSHADGHTHAEGSTHDDHDGDHGHEPVYGGLLVELGEHVAHVELVHDGEEGRLTLYSMDAHAEQAERLSATELQVVVEGAAEPIALTLLPEESALTGETVGDSSVFSAVDPRLVGLETLAGRIVALETRGQAFADVAFPAAQ
ncbi:MAG: hypothetical protein AAFZ65_04170 [Planctomycetota bacterium]